MGKSAETKRKSAPAISTEAREAQMINLATNLAERQLMNGSASSQVITHYLKLGTERTRLEREKLKAESDLAKAKVEAIKSQQTSEQLYQKAIEAFASYSGETYGDEDYDEYYD